MNLSSPTCTILAIKIGGSICEIGVEFLLKYDTNQNIVFNTIKKAYS